MRKLFKALAPLFFVLINPSIVIGQTCDSLVPFFVTDLSSDPDSLWISPLVQRSGLCCGEIAPNTCIEFEVTISPDAVGIIFTIYSGQLPMGAIFTKTNCIDPVTVGNPVYLTTPGPHSLTFCKPGTNLYQYGIQSIPDANSITLNNKGKYSIVIYPNPSSDYISLEPELPAVKIYNIIDISGKIIQSAAFDKAQKINIGYLTPGFYWIELLGEDRPIRHKILKQ